MSPAEVRDAVERSALCCLPEVRVVRALGTDSQPFLRCVGTLLGTDPVDYAVVDFGDFAGTWRVHPECLELT